MRILLSHCFGYEAETEFEAQAFSAQYLAPLPSWIDHLIVVQAPSFAWRPSSFLTAEGKIPSLVVCGRKLNMSALRNAAIEYVLAHSYDGWLDGDLDRVLFSPPSRLPDTGYATIPLYLGEEGKDHEETFRARWEGRLRQSLEGSSFFFVARRHLENQKIRFHEGYEGYGYEDVDFNEVVCARNGIFQSPTDAKAVHLWHPKRSWFSPEKFEANKRLFEERRA
jgi:hypothetical protein